MIKANQFQELTNKAKEQQLQRQRRIQQDMKLAEDSLNDLYIKVQKNINLGVTPPVYTEIPKLLEKEVQDNLIMEQNYFLDITKNGHTRIYYNKNDFEDNRENNLNKPLINENKKQFEKEYNTKWIDNKEDSKKDNSNEDDAYNTVLDLFDCLELLKNKNASYGKILNK